MGRVHAVRRAASKGQGGAGLRCCHVDPVWHASLGQPHPAGVVAANPRRPRHPLSTQVRLQRR